jgi:hypothetical protein
VVSRGNALRQIEAAKQQEHLPSLPHAYVPLREHDVVGHQQQACDGRVKPRRYLGEKAIGKPEPQEADGEDCHRALQLQPDPQRIQRIRK